MEYEKHFLQNHFRNSFNLFSLSNTIPLIKIYLIRFNINIISFYINNINRTSRLNIQRFTVEIELVTIITSGADLRSFSW